MEPITKIVVLLIYFWKISIAFYFRLIAKALALQFWQALDLTYLVLRSVLDGQAESCLRHRVNNLCMTIVTTISWIHNLKYVRSAAVCQVTLITIEIMFIHSVMSVWKSKIRVRLRGHEIDLCGWS
jgi:hypothetical protein